MLCKRNRPNYFPEDNFSNLVSVFVNKYTLYTYGKNPMKKLWHYDIKNSCIHPSAKLIEMIVVWHSWKALVSEEMTVVRLLIFLSLYFGLFLKLFKANDQCREGKCQTYSLDIYGDAVENFELIGHVFHQFASKNPIHCHSLCVDDCRCLSFNYKENNERNVCDLNEASHFTDPSSIKHSPGSRYYNLRRAFSGQKV